MTRIPLATAGLAALLLAAAALYLTRLAYVPPYLMQDEVNFSLQAHAIASTARDTNQRLLPLYFSETGFEAGRDPVMIYWTALFLTATPLSISSVRFPTALLAVLTIALMHMVASTLFSSHRTGLFAAALLAVTPGFFTNARLALSIVYGIPVITFWLYCLDRELDSRRGRWAMASGVCLGVGLYTYLAGMIIMPVLLGAATVKFGWKGRRHEAAWMLAGFAITLVPLAIWLVFHPDRYTSLVTAYRPTGLVTSVGVRERLTAFWMFFNPDYLFISGDGRLTNSTRYAGLFPIACAVWIPVGFYRLMRGDLGTVGLITATGFILSPVATAVSGRLEINRVLYVIPFGVLAAVAGARFLWASERRWRWLTVVLAASLAAQFAGFYRHYVGPYRVESAVWFGGNSQSAIDAVLDRMEHATPPVYLNRRTPIERYWRFVAATRQREDLADHPTYFDPNAFDPDTAPPGSLIVCEPDVPIIGRLATDGRWRLVVAATLPDGAVSHTVFERLPQPIAAK